MITCLWRHSLLHLCCRPNITERQIIGWGLGILVWSQLPLGIMSVAVWTYAECFMLIGQRQGIGVVRVEPATSFSLFKKDWSSPLCYMEEGMNQYKDPIPFNIPEPMQVCHQGIHSTCESTGLFNIMSVPLPWNYIAAVLVLESWTGLGKSPDTNTYNYVHKVSLSMVNNGFRRRDESWEIGNELSLTVPHPYDQCKTGIWGSIPKAAILSWWYISFSSKL